MPVITDALPQQRIHAGYGWVKDRPDFRDAYMAVEPLQEELPAKVDLSTSAHTPSVYNQLQLGSCTAHGIRYVIDFDNHLQSGHFLHPSRLWIYYWERYIEGTVNQDSGAQIRDGIQVMDKVGAPPETEWPYKIETFATLPDNHEQLAQDAKADRALLYQRVPQSQIAFQQVLAKGRPFVFGFTVYESFESQAVASTGIMPMPSPKEAVLGGHCVAGVGYVVINGVLYIKCRNSWGKQWGKKGYFFMPIAYILDPNLASDFWVVQSTTAKRAA